MRGDLVVGYNAHDAYSALSLGRTRAVLTCYRSSCRCSDETHQPQPFCWDANGRCFDQGSAAVYAEVCSVCHGADGVGQRAARGAGYQIPPLWGSDSYNNGAGMNRVLTAAAYAMHNMPLGTTFSTPVLTDADAYDVAAYIVSQNRPQKRRPRPRFPDPTAETGR